MIEAKSLIPIHFSNDKRKEMLVAVRLSLLLFRYNCLIYRLKLM